MAGKKHGSLFQSIADKSPDTAERLKKMAKGKKASPVRQNHGQPPKAEAPSQPKEGTQSAPQQNRRMNRMEGVAVERKSIKPRPKPQKKGNPKKSASSKGKPSKGRQTAGRSTPQPSRRNSEQADQNSRFFEGIPDNASQFGLNENARKLDIVAGVDFGTSSTKVVIHAPHYVGSPAYAVPFGEFAHHSLKYLLPTRLAVDQTGQCSLDPTPGASLITDIKVGLMHAPHAKIEPAKGPSCGASATIIATAYLALVLRYVRCWFIANKREAFGDFPLNWSWNLGLPAAIDDDDTLRDTFNTIGNAAWLASRRSGPITITAAQNAVNDFKSSKFKTEDMAWDFQLIPEVIAEVTGYARSQFRNEGLHLLVDVGASTLDLCSFILHEIEGEDQFPILTADVKLLGAKKLHQKRIEGAKKAVDIHAEKLFDEADPAGMIPDNLEDYVPTNQEISDEALKGENAFKGDCEKFLRKTIIDLRKNRDPNSPRWSESLPVFICGGASALQFYQEGITSLHEWLKAYIQSSHGARFIQLPKPESLEAELGDDLYHRLAVAWGLSHESFNIGTYTRPSAIDDVPPPPVRNVEDAFISKDQV